MKKLVVVPVLAALALPVASAPASADTGAAAVASGPRVCFPRHGNMRICVTRKRRYNRVCITFYLRSGGTIKRCHRRYR